MKNTSPVKNTDPKKLDRSNIGDAAVLVLPNGNTQSCEIVDVAPDAACFVWKVAPGRRGIRHVWIPAPQWLDRVTLFPAGCKFLAV